MSSFFLLKSGCPICGGIRNGKKKNDCKQSGELIHCFSHNDPPHGFRFVGQSAIGQSLYAPDRGENFDQEKHRAALARLRAENAAKEKRRLSQLPTIGDHHQEILGFGAKLTEAQNADLLRRCLTQDEINSGLSRHWLFACDGGYGVSAVDPVTGMLCGAQRARNDRDPKYDWGIFTGRNAIKETGENPLFIWKHPDFDSSKPYGVEFCEGALKSFIRASVRWRENTQVIVIGAAGGIFGRKSIKRALSVYGDAEKFTLFPDADSQNLKKKNIYAGYKNLTKAIPSIRLADWGQWRDKTKGDCDEYFGRYKRRSPWEWLKPFAFEKTRQKAKKRLTSSDHLTADLVLSLAEFEVLKRGEISLRDLTNKARDVLFQAGRGLGKTKFARVYADPWPRGIAPNFRRSLSVTNAQKLGYTYRTDLTIHNGQLFDGYGNFTSHLAYCSESRLSLTRPINNLLDRGAGCFIDEIDQQIKNLLMSSTHGKDGQRKINIQTFWQDIIRSQESLGASADITDYEVKLFERKTGRKPFVVKVESIKKKRVDTVFEDEVQWWRKFEQLQDEGQRVLVLCSRKSDTKFFAHAHDAIAIHADNANDFKGFLVNPDEWLRQHKPQLLAVSPILGTGFSIEADAFDAVMLYGWADNMAAPDLMQFLDRYRLPVPRYIWVEESNHQYDHITPEACFKARFAKAKASRFEGEHRWIDADDAYFHYQAEKNWSLAHLRADLLARLERDTETVIYDFCELPADEVKATMRAIANDRSEFKKHDAGLTATSPDITSAKAQEYRDKLDQLTEVERRSLLKFDIANWRVSEPETVTTDDVLRDRKGRRRKELEKLEMQAFPKIADAVDQASIDRQKNGISHQDISHHALRVKALENVGIGKILDHVLSGKEWHKEHPIVTEAAEILASKRDELALMGVRLTCGRKATPTAYFGALLRVFGLKSESKRVTMGDRRIWVYCLDADDLALTKADLVARLPRNIERYGKLNLSPETQWAKEVYGVSIPFENTNNQGCGQSLNPLQDIGSSNIEPEPDPPPSPPETVATPKPNRDPQKPNFAVGQLVNFWDGVKLIKAKIKTAMASPGAAEYIISFLNGGGAMCREHQLVEAR